MAANALTLFCLVDGESTANVFLVKATSISTIAELKDLIKAKKTPRFDDIAADELAIWRVSIPIVAAEMREPVIFDSLDSKEELGPAMDLSEVFKED
ncbi:hypothetical protein BGZ54_003326, partial [Gamsiella multidivaricata]